MTKQRRFLIPAKPFVGGTDTRQSAVDTDLLWLRSSRMNAQFPAHAANDNTGADQNPGHPDKQISQFGFCPANNTGRGTPCGALALPHFGLHPMTFTQ